MAISIAISLQQYAKPSDYGKCELRDIAADVICGFTKNIGA
jgi:hypothetical protein